MLHAMTIARGSKHLMNFTIQKQWRMQNAITRIPAEERDQDALFHSGEFDIASIFARRLAKAFYMKQTNRMISQTIFHSAMPANLICAALWLSWKQVVQIVWKQSQMKWNTGDKQINRISDFKHKHLMRSYESTFTCEFQHQLLLVWRKFSISQSWLLSKKFCREFCNDESIWIMDTECELNYSRITLNYANNFLKRVNISKACVC